MGRETVVDINEYEQVAGDDHQDVSSPFSDDIILLVVNGKKFNAHRDILAARSPVFDAMFNHDLVEQRKRQVDIPDCDPAVFEKFLHYIYSGTVDKKTLDKHGVQLWIAADKYQIEPLKRICEEQMCPILSASNVIDNLLLAHLFNIVRLKKECIEYITANCVNVIKRKDEWKHLIANGSPQLFAELFRDLAGKVRQTEGHNRQQKETIERLGSDQLLNERINQRNNVNIRKYFKIFGWTTLACICIAASVPIGIAIANGIPMWLSYLMLAIAFFVCLCCCKDTTYIERYWN